MRRKTITFADVRRRGFFSFVRSDGETFLKIDDEHFEDHTGKRYKINSASRLEPVRRGVN